MTHSYTVTLREKDESGSADDAKAVTFEVSSHDDILEIIDKVSTKGLFDDDETKAFCVGLKLFSGVMLKHRADPLFADLAPHFGAFMKALKSS